MSFAATVRMDASVPYIDRLTDRPLSPIKTPHNLHNTKHLPPQVITTRTYADRLQTIANVREAGISGNCVFFFMSCHVCVCLVLFV